MLRSRVAISVAYSQPVPRQCRHFSVAAHLQSGHSRWSKIKHDKGKADARKSKERTFLALAVIKASKEGGPDPKLNTTLAFAINNAKKGQLSKESIDKAIAKGQGKSVGGVPLESMLMEAMLPHGVAAMMEFQTESKNRIIGDVKSIVQRAGGSLTPTAFLFNKKGRLWFQPHEKIGVDEALEEAIEAGAEEITLEDGKIVVDTTPELVTTVAQRMHTHLGLELERSEILYDPNPETRVKLNDDQSTDIQNVIDLIEDMDDLQDLYINATD